MEESVVDPDEIEGGEVTRGRACTRDDLVSTCTHARCGGEAEGATEGDITRDGRERGGGGSGEGAWSPEDRSIGAGERELTSDRQARGIKRRTRGNRERLGGTHIDGPRTRERLARGERKARGSRGVERACGTDRNRGRCIKRAEGREGERTTVDIKGACERVDPIERERPSPALRERPCPADGVGEGHIVTVRIDGTGLRCDDRQTAGDIVGASRGELQRRIAREG